MSHVDFHVDSHVDFHVDSEIRKKKYVSLYLHLKDFRWDPGDSTTSPGIGVSDILQLAQNP